MSWIVLRHRKFRQYFRERFEKIPALKIESFQNLCSVICCSILWLLVSDCRDIDTSMFFGDNNDYDKYLQSKPKRKTVSVYGTLRYRLRCLNVTHRRRSFKKENQIFRSNYFCNFLGLLHLNLYGLSLSQIFNLFLIKTFNCANNFSTSYNFIIWDNVYRA